MDIEGGEKIVVPAMADFLRAFKPVFYISLHRCFLKSSDVDEIIDILFEIYDKCYVFSNTGEKLEVNKETVKIRKIEGIVFE